MTDQGPLTVQDASQPLKGPKLLPCPFCGGPAEYEECPQGSSASPYSATWTVGCANDEVDCIGYQMIATFSRRVEAAQAWNTRSLPVNAGSTSSDGPPKNALFDQLDKAAKRASQMPNWMVNPNAPSETLSPDTTKPQRVAGCPGDCPHEVRSGCTDPACPYWRASPDTARADREAIEELRNIFVRIVDGTNSDFARHHARKGVAKADAILSLLSKGGGTRSKGAKSEGERLHEIYDGNGRRRDAGGTCT